MANGTLITTVFNINTQSGHGELAEIGAVGELFVGAV